MPECNPTRDLEWFKEIYTAAAGSSKVSPQFLTVLRTIALRWNDYRTEYNQKLEEGRVPLDQGPTGAPLHYILKDAINLLKTFYDTSKHGIRFAWAKSSPFIMTYNTENDCFIHGEKVIEVEKLENKLATWYICDLEGNPVDLKIEPVINCKTRLI